MCRLADAHRQKPRHHLFHHRARYQRRLACRSESTGTHYGHRAVFRRRKGRKLQASPRREKPFRLGAGSRRFRNDGKRLEKRAFPLRFVPVRYARRGGGQRGNPLRQRQQMYERRTANADFAHRVRLAAQNVARHRLQQTGGAYRRSGKALRRAVLSIGRIHQRDGRHPSFGTERRPCRMRCACERRGGYARR